MASEGQQLQYAPFSSALDAGFWHKLSKLKLDVYGLDDEPKKIHGFYFNGNAPGIPSQMNLDFTAFDSEVKTPPRHFTGHGILKNTNTIDDFKNCDKATLLNKYGNELWNNIISGKAIEDPSLLSNFVLLTFADLKKYHYWYWFAFPALTLPENVTMTTVARQIDQRFSQQHIDSLLHQYSTLCMDQQVGYFLIQEQGESLITAHLRDFEKLSQNGPVILAVCDPCTLELHPGWPLRNLLTLAAYHWCKSNCEYEVVCLRDRTKDGKRGITHSITFKVLLTDISSQPECPKCVGWEKNERQKMGPRKVNLSASMDPTKLAESAVDLNLKLMRWRLLPELDLDKVAETKCLLLGSGTLGCNIARCLLGWGVRTITLVDNGRISYSNPVRQSLFTFNDSLSGGKPKAEAAAEALKLIFPGVNAKGVMLSIPMPGHLVTDADIEQIKKDVAILEDLVDEHDVVFLLMDTRESRWLPTVLAAAKRKLVINAALGFDTFLVVRHGVRSDVVSMETDEPVASFAAEDGPSTSKVKTSSSFHNVPGNELGCYFCNDVVAPGDSTKDRTLDQQCTVSRPGMSYLAAALAVELMVSVLQHPKGVHAPADTSAKDDHFSTETASPLGLVPHQIRGFLSRFHQLMPVSRAFDQCTACSTIVWERYEKEGFNFLLKVFNEPNFLEELTGLSKLHADTFDAEVWELSDDEEM